MDGDIEDGDFGHGGLGREDVDLQAVTWQETIGFFGRQSSAFCLSVSIYALEFSLAMAR